MSYLDKVKRHIEAAGGVAIADAPDDLGRLAFEYRGTRCELLVSEGECWTLDGDGDPSHCFPYLGRLVQFVDFAARVPERRVRR